MKLRWALVLLGLAAGAGFACSSSDTDGSNDSSDGSGGDGSGGASSGGTGGDAGASGAAEFEYVPVDGAVCGKGSPLGVGISEGEDARALVLFLNGGGACWDDLTCFGLNAASHIWTDYDAELLERDLEPVRRSGLLDRDQGATPFSDATMVFVPYCTGDLFAGNTERDYRADLLGQDVRRVHHAGRANVGAILELLAERFPAVEQVYLMGASAGGYGALINYERVAEAFPSARVDLLADGSPAIEPTGGLYATWRSRWGVEGPDCEGCETSFGAVVEALHAAHEDRRFALLSSRNDEVIRAFFGYGLEDIGPRVDALVSASYERNNAHAFVIDGSEHVLLGGYLTRRGPGGTTLADFVAGWATGGDDFVTVRP